MRKRTIVLPLISIFLAVLLCVGYGVFVSSYGIQRLENGYTGGTFTPNKTAFHLLKLQLKFVPDSYKETYYEHLLAVYYRPDTQFDYVDTAEAPAVYEAYFAYEKAYREKVYDMPYPMRHSLFSEKNFTDDSGKIHTVRSDDDLYTQYFCILYDNGRRNEAKQAFEAYFSQTDNHLTYRYFLTYLFAKDNLPAEDRQWAEEQAKHLIATIQAEDAAFHEQSVYDSYSPYYIKGRADIAIYDLERYIAG